jgi:hypothetical protein
VRSRISERASGSRSGDAWRQRRIIVFRWPQGEGRFIRRRDRYFAGLVGLGRLCQAAAATAGRRRLRSISPPASAATREVAGLLLMIPALQMIAGRPAPVFPRRIAADPLPTRHLGAIVQRAVPVPRYLEKIIHPRWPDVLAASKRLDGVVVVLLSGTMLVPVPLSNVIPALVIALISLAYLEEDGLLLAFALLAGVIALALAAAAAWETVRGAEWLGRLW